MSCDYQLFVNGKEQICVVQSAPEYRLGRNICVYRLDIVHSSGVYNVLQNFSTLVGIFLDVYGLNWGGGKSFIGEKKLILG